MKKINTLALVIIMSLSAMMNTACTKEEIIDNSSSAPIHHVGLYSLSKDLLEIYDVQVEAICDGKTVNTIDLKQIEAYSEDDCSVSYNVDLYTASPVEYKLSLKCCKTEKELDGSRNYGLGFDAQFMNVTRSPEKALEILNEASDCMLQSINGISLKSYYGATSEFQGKTVYAVYAIVNTRSFMMSN